MSHSENAPPLSKRLSRRAVISGVALAGASAAAYALLPHRQIDLFGKQKLEELVPTKVGPWSFVSRSGLVVPPADSFQASIYNKVLTRVYSAADRPPVMLLIAQSAAQDGLVQVHRPEVCYPAGGYALSGSRVHPIVLPNSAAIPTRAMTATDGQRIEQLLYWTRIGSDLPTDWTHQRLAVAEANLRGEIPDGVLVRLSALSPDPASIGELDRFVVEMLEAMPTRARAALVGPLTW